MSRVRKAATPSPAKEKSRCRFHIQTKDESRLILFVWRKGREESYQVFFCNFFLWSQFAEIRKTVSATRFSFLVAFCCSMWAAKDMHFGWCLSRTNIHRIYIFSFWSRGVIALYWHRNGRTEDNQRRTQQICPAGIRIFDVMCAAVVAILSRNAKTDCPW